MTTVSLISLSASRPIFSRKNTAPISSTKSMNEKIPCRFILVWGKNLILNISTIVDIRYYGLFPLEWYDLYQVIPPFLMLIGVELLLSKTAIHPHINGFCHH